jgi:hypothetical protein
MRRLKTELRMFPPLKALWLVDESGSAFDILPLKSSPWEHIGFKDKQQIILKGTR